ncbi:hypothetical protein M513_04318 [Trichuris suis]|uniref:RNA helicase n=1 Tax=Trichuris suis TaxID=68888 RepID=A0A085MCD8_9BILA|nr:hypothetical protein M513_04318 [Trichuris suis]
MEVSPCAKEASEQPSPVYDFHYVESILLSGIQDRDAGRLSVRGEESLGLYVAGLTFEQLGLKSEILQGVYNYPYQSPSLIQSAVISAVLEDQPKDMIVQSQNGTGKTAAFAVTILEKVDLSMKWPQCVCVAPTYELAVQVGSVIQKLGAFMPELRICLAVRETDEQEANCTDRITDHVIVGTPGTIIRWSFSQKRLDFSKVKLFVVDEADVMINTGNLGKQTSRIVSRLPRNCQKLFFSATLDENSEAFLHGLCDRPMIFRLRDEELSLDNVFQFYVQCENDEDKFAAIVDVYNSMIIGQCMIFCRTRRSAHDLWRNMREAGHAVSLLTAELTVRERAVCLQNFRNGTDRVLIVTNVCARGIDVPYLNLVVNYDLPILRDGTADFYSYLHRIGRSGRFGMSGVALTFVQNAAEVKIVEQIACHFGKPINYLTREQLKAIDEIVDPDL